MIGPFSQALRRKLGIRAILTFAVATILLGGEPRPRLALCQDADVQRSAQSDVAAGRTADNDLDTQVRDLVEGLRSDQFALREQSSETLFQLGHACLPILRSVRRQSDDAEQSDRLDHIIESLAKQDLESRIRSFLKGGPSELDNWSEMEKWFGDSPRIREMFVDLYREHPYLVESLGGTPQQMSLGLSRVRRRLMERGVGPRETPHRIDLIALLLPMTDPEFQAGPQYDMIVASLLQLYPANDFRNDKVFGEPFMRMVSTWMRHSDLGLREQVLRLALQWKMDIALPLALETLKQNPDPVLLCRCMQTIARQGTLSHAALLAGYINDTTVVFQKRYPGNIGSEVQVGDVAAATIAFLASVPVTEIGFAEPAEHPVFAIIYEELVVPLKDLPEVAEADGEKSGEKESDDSDDKDPTLDEFEDSLDEIQLDQNGLQFQQFRRPSRQEIARLKDQIRRREAARIEIHLKALKLVPTG